MKVRFEPLHGQDYVSTPDIGGGFAAGQVRDLSDEDAQTILTNPNFVDDTTGKNPLHCCADCGAPLTSYVRDADGGLVMPEKCPADLAKDAAATALAASTATPATSAPPAPAASTFAPATPTSAPASASSTASGNGE